MIKIPLILMFFVVNCVFEYEKYCGTLKLSNFYTKIKQFHCLFLISSLQSQQFHFYYAFLSKPKSISFLFKNIQKSQPKSAKLLFFSIIVKLMDDIFLYNHIKQAIKQRKKIQKNTESNNFAQNYCRRELMKKKINFDSTSHQSAAIKKMKLLMKNFEHVETYIDLNELLYNINTIKVKEQAQNRLKQVHQKQKMSRISRLSNLNNETKPFISRFHEQKDNSPALDPIQALKEKFKGQINEMLKRKYQSENSQMDYLVDHLENDSSLYNSLLKNNSTNYLSYLNNQLQKIQKEQIPTGQKYEENQRIFKYLTQNLSQTQNIQKQKSYFRSTNLNSKQKKQENQLLHKISTFLQIALENQHKQKWATKQVKKFRSTHGSFRFNKDNQQRSKFFLKSLLIDKQNKQIFQNKKSKSKKSEVKKSTFFIDRTRSLQRSQFAESSLKKYHTSFDNINQLSMNPRDSHKQHLQSFEKNKQNENLLKFFYRENEKARKTVPVQRQNFESSLDQIQKEKDFLSQNNIKQNQPNTQTKNSQIEQKKKYHMLNKGRKVRQYNFISPSRENIHYKTVIVASNHDTSINDFSENPSINIVQTKENYKDRKQLQRQSQSESQSLNLTPVTSFLGKSKSNLSLNRKKMSKKSIISENFTFKKRNKKQQILNKLNSFIEGITQQQKISKQQNQYYDSAINQLQDISKTTYKNYEPQALAGMQEISELKKFVSNINPSLRKNYSKKSVGKRDL